MFHKHIFRLYILIFFSPQATKTCVYPLRENVYGKQIELDNIDKVQGVIIRLRKNENVKTSKNVLIAMLEELREITLTK